MGILNLHKFLDKCATRSHLSALRGAVVGVDAMCWLHRGSVASAWELLVGEDTDKFLRFFVKMLALCNACGVTPIVVFDGASLPAKAEEEAIRRARRAENREKAKAEIEKLGVSKFASADPKLRSAIVQSVSISPEMITRTMSVLRRLGVDFLVAPFEADAQLAFMYAKGQVSAVVSEDSDLLAFGCFRLVSKLDTSGDFVDLRLDWAFRGTQNSGGKPEGELGKLEKWTPSLFTDLCILAGSDYKLGKVAGIGIKKAFALLCKYGCVDRVVRVLAEMRKWTKEEVDKFKLEFAYSKSAFAFHRVFDVSTATCVTMSESAPRADLVPVVGEPVEPALCREIMTGAIDAKTRERRVFLDKLPKGVLGVYRASLRQADDPSRHLQETTSSSESFDALEAQVVAEFAKFRSVDTKKANSNYLDGLEKLILRRGDDEFGRLDEFAALDEGDSFDGIDLDALDELQTQSFAVDDVGTSVLVPSQAPVKLKNPFAKPAFSKKPKTDPFVLTAAPAPKNPLMDLLRGNTPAKPASFVTHRDLVRNAGNGFVRRSA